MKKIIVIVQVLLVIVFSRVVAQTYDEWAILPFYDPAKSESFTSATLRETVHLSKQETESEWVTDHWVATASHRKSFFNDCQLASDTTFIAGAPAALILYQYHPLFYGALTKNYGFAWNGNTWDTVSRYEATYYYNGAIGMNLRAEYSNGLWDTSYIHNRVRTYDNEGRRLTYTYQNFNFTTNQFDNDYQVIYQYDGDSILSGESTYDWNGTAFIPDFNYAGYSYNYYTSSVDFQLNHKLIQDWVGSWQTTFRDTVVYDSYGSSITLTESTDGLNWYNYSLTSYLKDAHGNFTEFKDEFWEGNQWEILFQFKDSLTYDLEDNLLEDIYQVYDFNTEQMVNEDKYNYADFSICESPSGIADAEVTTVVLFPNPLSNELHISIDNETRLEVVITDLPGNKIIVQSLDVGAAIDLTGLKNGLYLIQLFDQHHKLLKTEKILKQ